MTIADSLLHFAGEHASFVKIVEAAIADWHPEQPPITLVFAELGEIFIAEADRQRVDEIVDVFGRLEDLLVSGKYEEREGASTGFLEAVATNLDEAPDRRWILDHAGPAALAFLAAWDEFCGVEPPRES